MAVPMRVGYLGPAGTFTHAAALAGAAGLPDLTGAELVAKPTIYDVVMAVAGDELELAVVPIENSIEGSVSATLDTLAIDATEVRIVAEHVHRIEQCLIAGEPIALTEVATVMSHPQASAQCARFLHDHLPQADVVTTSSTADAVRMVAEHGAGWAALGPRLAAERYGCVLLAEGVEDRAGNETRFVWLAPAASALPPAGAPTPEAAIPAATRPATSETAWPFKTSLLFWGDGTGRPGWLVRCLSELSDRGVNMTRIESRPRKQGLGLYMFFIDCEGTAQSPPVAAALAALAEHTEVLRVLGSYPAA
jgi:prephenate dehydratase